MPPELRDAYLARLGLDAEPPSADALFRLHRAHAERVPYETLWIHAGDAWGIDATDAATRIATQRRGGYCFHLNGALSELLRTLGYAVTRHVGGVHGPPGPSDDLMANHLVLTVRGLPTDANPGGVWYVDVGLGDALHEPLPLLAGTYRQGPYRLGLGPDTSGIGDWHLAHDPAGSFSGMSWRTTPVGMDSFAARHAWLSTSPESGFVRVLTVQRRDASGADVLRGLVLKRVGARAPGSESGTSETTLTTRAELADALADVFGLEPPAPGAFDALWARTQAAHVAWEAAGRP